MHAHGAANAERACAASCLCAEECTCMHRNTLDNGGIHDLEENNCWVKSLILFSLYTKRILLSLSNCS